MTFESVKFIGDARLATRRPDGTSQDIATPSLHQRELQQTRRVTLAFAGAVIVVVLILLAGFATQFVINPNQSLGSVGSTTITRGMYQKFRAWTLYNQ